MPIGLCAGGSEKTGGFTLPASSEVRELTLSGNQQVQERVFYPKSGFRYLLLFCVPIENRR
jgi:hypothetical protein